MLWKLVPAGTGLGPGDGGSGEGAVDEVTVFLYRAGQHSEMDLAVVIDSHHPDHRLGVAVPSDQHHSRTDTGRVVGFAERRPAESLVVFSVEVGHQVDLRVHRLPPPSRLRIVVGVRHDLTRAAGKLSYAVVEVIEADSVMARVAAGRLQPHPSGQNVPDPQEGQATEPDQRRLLC